MMKQQRFMTKTLFTLLLMLMGIASSWAQKTVTGTVKDAKGELLPSVTILEKGTQNGVLTDFDGNFSIKVADNATLIFTFVGFTPQEVAVGSQTVLAVKLLEDAKTLGEVVVVGYGTQRKKDLTGSVASLSERNFQKGNIASPEQLIAGKIAGVAITQGSGAPGSASRIRIRGGASFGDDKPLIVIDGVPLGNDVGGIANPLATLNPNDIESVNILKDASAAAIYGSRASNGVIIVTTKKGAKGAMKINFSTVVSSAQAINFVPVMTGDELRAFLNTPVTAESPARSTSDQKKLLGAANTDWQSLIYRNAISHDENLSVTGAAINNTLPYRLSLGYLNQNGILKNSNMDRKSVNLNLNPRFFDDHLKVDISYKGSFITSKFADEGAIGAAVGFDPTQAPYTSKDAYQGYFEWLSPSGIPDPLAGRNPLGILNSRTDVYKVNRHIANAIFDYKFHFFPDLRFNMNVAVDRANTDGYQTKDTTAASAFVVGGVNNATVENRTAKTFESYLNYTKEVSGFRADVMAGYGYQDFYFEATNKFFNQRGQPEGDQIPSRLNPKHQTTLVSFFGRANFGFKDRYLATFTMRRDGSSRLAPGYKWITYPAAALAWRMTEDGIRLDVN